MFYDIENIYKYHAPTDAKAEKYAEIRRHAKILAILIVRTVPEGRERSLALTKLEESVMWANAGVARNE